MIKLDELEKELRKGEIRPAYLLAGEEPLLRDDALAAIRAVALASGPEDFNLDRLPGDKTTPAALQDSVRNLPVMAEHRLVILSEPQARRGGGKELLDALADVVMDVQGQAQTVLVVTAAKADKRSRWVKAFSGRATVVECEPPKNTRSLAAFVKREAKRQGISIEAGAPELLAERVGPQLLMLRHELEKAMLLAGPDQAVTRAHVEASSSQLAEQPIWDLSDAIGAGKIGEALGLLTRIRHGGAAGPVILSTLGNHFRKLSRVQRGAAVPGPPFIVRKLESQARRYKGARLIQCLREIHAADTALKGASALPENLVLERLVLELSR
jgi:DNA polymerase-3 subunit delta